MSLEIGRKFVVFRTGEDVAQDLKTARLPILLGQGRAFGSGGHETTRSCLEEIEALPDMNNAAVLDLGSGTGILSIAAAKLGVGRVSALDPDKKAFDAASRNIHLNGVESTVNPKLGTLEDLKGEKFDLILANLYGDVLLDLLDDLVDKLNPGGILLVSGIHYEYVFEIRQGIIRRGLKLIKSRYLEEYITLVFSLVPD